MTCSHGDCPNPATHQRGGFGFCAIHAPVYAVKPRADQPCGRRPGRGHEWYVEPMTGEAQCRACGAETNLHTSPLPRPTVKRGPFQRTTKAKVKR